MFIVLLTMCLCEVLQTIDQFLDILLATHILCRTVLHQFTHDARGLDDGRTQLVGIGGGYL